MDTDILIENKDCFYGEHCSSICKLQLIGWQKQCAEHMLLTRLGVNASSILFAYNLEHIMNFHSYALPRKKGFYNNKSLEIR